MIDEDKLVEALGQLIDGHNNLVDNHNYLCKKHNALIDVLIRYLVLIFLILGILFVWQCATVIW